MQEPRSLSGSGASRLGSARAEELRDGLQRGLLGDHLGAEEDRELARVAGSDRVHVGPVLRGELLTGLDLHRDLRAVDRVAAHEALAILVLGLERGLLPGRLQRVQEAHRLLAKGGLGFEAGLDLGLGEEGVEVGGLGGFDRGCHDGLLFRLGWVGSACLPRRPTSRTAGRL